MKRFFAIFIYLFLLVQIIHSQDISAQLYNIAIFYDYSGSMKKIDKNNLRIKTMHAINKEIGSLGSIGLAKFSSTPTKIFVNAKDFQIRKIKLEEFEKSIKDNGKYTDFDKAISLGVNMIHNQDGENKKIIILSDGIDDYKGFNNSKMLKTVENSGIEIVLLKFGKKKITKKLEKFLFDSNSKVIKISNNITETNEKIFPKLFEQKQVIASLPDDYNKGDKILFDDDIQVLPNTQINSAFFVDELALGLQIQFTFPYNSNLQFNLITPHNEHINENSFEDFGIIYHYANQVLEIYIPSPELGKYDFSFEAESELLSEKENLSLDKIHFYVKLDNYLSNNKAEKIEIRSDKRSIFINDKFISKHNHTAFYPTGKIYEVKLESEDNSIERKFILGNYPKIIISH